MKIYLSPIPNLQEAISLFKKKQVNVVCSLITETEIRFYYKKSFKELRDYYLKNEIDFLFYPILDGSVPADMKSFDNLILELLNRHRTQNILIHCIGGHGRTGLVASALLIKQKNMSSPESIKTIRKIRSGTVETQEQENFLKEYERFCKEIL